MQVDRRSFVLGAGVAALLPATAAAADDVVRIPITLTDRRVLVACSIGGSGPLPFVFDTGGAFGLIDMALAESLQLRRMGALSLSLKLDGNVGRRSHPLFAARNLAFGGQVRQPEAVFAGVADFFPAGEAGSLAAGVLSTMNSELDFGANEWRIHRSGVPDRAGWTRYDRAIVRQAHRNGSAFLFADAMLGGRSFRLGLDTGMLTGLRIYRKTAEAADLWNAPRWTPAAPGGRARMARLPALTLAGTQVDGLVVAMLEQPEWDVFDAGIIGLPLLRRFDMATDPASGATFLRRNALPAEPDRYNRAGMWIDRDAGGVKVGPVGPGSPAAAAGLAPGDRLVGADFAALVERVYAPAGTRIPLTVERGGARREVELTLADFL